MASLQGVKKEEEDLRLLTGYGHGENWQFRLNLTLFSSAMIFIGACSARTAVIPIIQYGGKRVL